jgi:sugar phosphate isomerase/epimerase
MIRRSEDKGSGLSFSLAASADEAQGAIEAARAKGLGVEISLFDTVAYLDSPSALVPIAALSRQKPRVPLSAHGPIYDLNAGSPEPAVREFTVRAMTAAVRATQALGAARMVVHTGFNPLLPRNVERPWCASAAEAMQEVAAAARQCDVLLLLENFFEESPETLLRLADAIGDGVGFCLDLAHVRLRSSVPFGEWLKALGSRLAEFHLNDCDGNDDLHLALGEGVCEVIPFLEAVASSSHRSAPVVLEMSLERAAKSLAFIDAHGFRPRTA